MESWQEASGSPVFVEGKLAGIVSKKHTFSDPKISNAIQVIPGEVKATYLKRLWEDTNTAESEFRKIIEERFLQKPSPYKGKITLLFKEREELKTKLKKALRVDTAVVDAFLAMNKKQIMDTCKKLLDQEKTPELKLLLLYAMAYKYEQIKWDTNKQEEGYINVPVVRVEACEFLMAAKDQRDPLFSTTNQHGDKLKVIAGKFSIITPPENGIHGAAASRDNIMDNLLAGRADLTAVIERLFGEYNRQSHIQYTQDKKRNIVMTILDESEGTYYWLLTFSKGNSENIKNILKKLPIEILNVATDEDGNIDMEEENLFKSLSNFI